MDGGHLVVHNSYHFLLIVRKINHVILNVLCDLNANGIENERERERERDGAKEIISSYEFHLFIVVSLIEMAPRVRCLFINACSCIFDNTDFILSLFLSLAVCVWGVFFFLLFVCFVCFSSLHCVHSHKWRASFLSIGADFFSRCFWLLAVVVVVVISCVNPKKYEQQTSHSRLCYKL